MKFLSARYFELPDFVKVIAIGDTGDEGAETVGEEELGGIEIPSALARAVPKRVLEYRLGRIAAVRALRALGLDVHEGPARGSSGEPVWPQGIVGSITHTRGFTAAVAAQAARASAIGIDAEVIERVERLHAAAAAAFTAEEWNEMNRRLSEHPTSDAFRLGIFSAKESVMKCLLSRVTPVDFGEIRLRHFDATGPNTLTAHFDHSDQTHTATVLISSTHVYSSALIIA